MTAYSTDYFPRPYKVVTPIFEARMLIFPKKRMPTPSSRVERVPDNNLPSASDTPPNPIPSRVWINHGAFLNMGLSRGSSRIPVFHGSKTRACCVFPCASSQEKSGGVPVVVGVVLCPSLLCGYSFEQLIDSTSYVCYFEGSTNKMSRYVDFRHLDHADMNAYIYTRISSAYVRAGGGY